MWLFAIVVALGIAGLIWAADHVVDTWGEDEDPPDPPEQ